MACSARAERVHYESEPEPVWVQTPVARWVQSTTEVRMQPAPRATPRP